MELVQFVGSLNAVLFAIILFFLKRIYSQHEINSIKIRDLEKDIRHLTEKLSEFISIASRVGQLEKDVSILLYLRNEKEVK